MSQSNRGILLLGCPRSGTTLLRRLLGNHSNIASPGETGLFRGAANFLRKDTTGVGVDLGVLSGLGHIGVNEKKIKSRLVEFVFSFLDEYTESAGKKRWLEKDAFNAFNLPEIEDIFADKVRYICLVRHGLDVAVSLDEFSQKSRTYVLELHNYVQRSANPLEAFATAWVDISANLRNLLQSQGDNAILVKYEDLVADPDSELERILHFLDEPAEEGMIENALNDSESIGLSDWKSYARASIGAESIGRWSSLPPYTISKLASIANETLQVFGYDEIDDEWNESPELARRRYEIGLALNLAKGQGINRES
jgi:protein-tyrosine sulfotransferase